MDNGDLSLMVVAEMSQKRFLIVSINESLDVNVYSSLILNGFKPTLILNEFKPNCSYPSSFSLRTFLVQVV